MDIPLNLKLIEVYSEYRHKGRGFWSVFTACSAVVQDYKSRGAVFCFSLVSVVSILNSGQSFLYSSEVDKCIAYRLLTGSTGKSSATPVMTDSSILILKQLLR